MKKFLVWAVLPFVVPGLVHARNTGHHPDESVVAVQNAVLEKNMDGKGYGPQSPRDLANKQGNNNRKFSTAPAFRHMNLCNIHFHKNAEHKGGEFTTPASDGEGRRAGYKYSGKLGAAESKPLTAEVCNVEEEGGLQVGDTVELHYVYSSARVAPGPSLDSCMSESVGNPQLRVEAQVFVLVNDPKAADFSQLTKFGELNGYYQALNIPKNTGRPLQYAGSTTGPDYNEKGSPLQVSWGVRPRVMKVNAESVGQWCKGNVFKENHGHGVRNLVINEKLLSKIK